MFWKKPVVWEPVCQYNKVPYPSETAVETSDEKFWYIKGNRRFRIPSTRVLHSWDFKTMAYCTPEVLADYKIHGTLGFRGGTLIRNVADAKVYLISDLKKRHIVSPDVYEKYGLNPENIIEVSEEEANLHDDGEVLS